MEPPAVESCCPDTLKGVINTVEMHTGGEPVRIVVSGYPEIKGSTILDKRQYVKENFDALRVMLMSEPRGHDGMYGVIIVNCDLPEASMAVLFMHGEGYSTMCGHATISLGRYAVDYRIVPPVSPVTSFTLQCPCGPVKVKVQYSNNKTGGVSFESVPSWVEASNQVVTVPQLNRMTVSYDLVYSGAFYAVVEASNVGIDLLNSPISQCVNVAGSITDQLRMDLTLSHPDSPDLGFLYGTILTGPGDTKDEALILCIFAERQVSIVF
jgi:trans-L-3-hydroxyproline dehydratase